MDYFTFEKSSLCYSEPNKVVAFETVLLEQDDNSKNDSVNFE